MRDPLDDVELEQPTLKEMIQPYEKYGDAELAVSLLAFQRRFAEPRFINTHKRRAVFDVDVCPAAAGFTYRCDNCEENVRAVTKGMHHVSKCPLCGELPSMLALGRGPVTQKTNFEEPE